MKAASTQERILQAANDILEAQGPDGLTTRAVCDAIGITAPTLYHHFGDKDGLVRALVRHGIAEFMARKRGIRATRDPVADLRRGWDSWLGFALARPRLFRLMAESARSDPAAMSESYAVMRQLVERLGVEGRLRSDAESAAQAIWAASNGVLMMFLQGRDRSEIMTTADLLFEALLGRLIQPGSAARS